MRLVIARCSVDYVGRLDAHLPMADRLLLLKADGSVSVHADDRAYKPLNWMTPPCTLEESEIKDIDGEPTGEYLWLVENKKGDQLRITIEEIHQDRKSTKKSPTKNNLNALSGCVKRRSVVGS